MSRFAAVALASSFFVACLLPDFTVVNGDSSASDGGPDTGRPDGSSSGDSSTGPDGSTEGGLVCMQGFGDCDNKPGNGCETDLRISNDHCGACGRSCGMAGCDKGDCKPEPVVAGLTQPFGLELAGLRMVWHEPQAIYGCRISDCASSKAIMVDVSGGTNFPDGTFSPNPIAVEADKFYFSQCPPGQNTDCSPASCDIAGCKLTGATFLMGAGSGYRRSQLITKRTGFIVGFHGLDGLYRVPIAGGAAEYQEGTLFNVQDSLQAIDYGPTDTVILDPDASQANPVGGLFTCPTSGCVGAKKRILPPPVRHLAVAAGNAYTSSGAEATASIIECAIAGCQSAGTPLATNQAYVSDIAADDKAVYWLTLGAQNAKTNTAAVGTLVTCPLPGCPGGPKKIDGLLNPSRVRIDATHVYWMERGAPAMPNGKIWRKRR